MPAGAGSNITIAFDCSKATTGGANNNAPTKFTVSFNPTGPGGSGIADKAIGTLALNAGGAENVAIALFQDDKLIHLQNSQPAVKGEIAGAVGTMNLRAMYVRSTDKAIKPGAANASLPFTLRYE
jgi:type 1 fimbria pilin